MSLLAGMMVPLAHALPTVQAEQQAWMAQLSKNIQDLEKEMHSLQIKKQQTESNLTHKKTVLQQLKDRQKQISEQLKTSHVVSQDKTTPMTLAEMGSGLYTQNQMTALWSFFKQDEWDQRFLSLDQLKTRSLVKVLLSSEWNLDTVAERSGSSRQHSQRSIEETDQKHLHSLKPLELELLNLTQDYQIYQKYLQEILVQEQLLLQKKTNWEQQRQLANAFYHEADLRPLKGKLPAPVPGYLIQRYGTSGKDPSALQNQTHGIILETNPQAKVQAIALGKIVFADTVPGYQQLVIIDHGQQLFSVYGQLQSLQIRPDDFVTQGTVLGHVGRDPITLKDHAYFEMRLGNRSMNPLPWLGPNSYPLPFK